MKDPRGPIIATIWLFAFLACTMASAKFSVGLVCFAAALATMGVTNLRPWQ